MLLTQSKFKTGDRIKILHHEGIVHDITGDLGIILDTDAGSRVFVPAPAAAAAVVEVWPAGGERKHGPSPARSASRRRAA